MENSFLGSSVLLDSVIILQMLTVMAFWAGCLCLISVAIRQDLRHKDPKLALQISKT